MSFAKDYKKIKKETVLNLLENHKEHKGLLLQSLNTILREDIHFKNAVVDWGWDIKGVIKNKHEKEYEIELTDHDRSTITIIIGFDGEVRKTRLNA